MKDLFEDYKNQPKELTDILTKYEHEDSIKLLSEVNAIGYIFDYGLDAEPFGLRPINIKLSQLS
jgi:hypothetical protein